MSNQNDALKIYTIILNWNNFSDTSKCIESLLSLNDERIVSVVVDNCSSDDSFNQLQEKYPDLIFLKTDSNLGYAGGMNTGIKYAIDNRADYILISNNDIIYTPDFLSPMLKLITSVDSIGIVSPKVLYTHDNNKIYCAGGYFSLLRASGVAAFRNKDSNLFGNETRKISMAEGSCFLAKRIVFEKCGLISEKFFMYFEDLEFSDRVRKHFDIYYTPDSIVYHKGGAGLSWSDHSKLYYYYYTRNRYLYFSEFGFMIRLYVFFYSLSVTVLKFISLLKSSIFDKDNRESKINSISALIKANADGIRLLWKKSNNNLA
jgi:GT2 family glycosyltransferase